MAKSLDSLTSFTAGELSPKLDARVDFAKYKTGLRQCENMIPYKTGGLTRRPGTEFAGAARLTSTAGHNYSSRLVPFTFSPETAFMLEFGNQYLRVYTSNGTQATVTTADLPFWISIYAYTPGQYVQHGGVAYYCIAAVPAQIPPASNSPPASDPTHWSAQTIIEQPTPYNADAGSSGPQPGSIYGTDIWSLSFCQINDIIYITSPSYPVYKLTRYSNEDWQFQEVNFNAPALLDQNATDTQITASDTTGTGITLTASAPAFAGSTYYNIGNSVEVSSVIYTCVLAYVSTATFTNDLAAGYWQEMDVFNSLQVGGTWQLAYLRPSAYIEVDGTAASGFTDGTSSSIQALGSWEVHTYGVWSSDLAIQRSLDGGQTWDTVRSVTGRSDRNVDISGTAVQLGLYQIVISNSSSLVNAGATNPRVVFECVDAFLYGLVQITAVASAISATANVITQLASTAATEYWSEAAWSNYRGFPQAVTSFQQRIIYASSGFEPQRIWGTVTNDIENFALGDQTMATDSFAFDLNAPSRGPIQWLIAQTDLFAGFSGAEWVINSGSSSTAGQQSGAAITPTSINAVEHSSWGSAANVAPAIVGDAVIYAQRQATSIRQMMFSIYTAKYMSQDLTVLSDHLFASGIAQMAYMTRWRKQSIIWAVTQQGSLCGMTYELDQEVFGWHRHITGYGQYTPAGVAITPDNGFESVAVIDGLGQQDDQVWVIANRLVNGANVRYVERLNPNNWEETFTGPPNPPAADVTQAFYVDSGLTLTGLGYTYLRPGGVYTYLRPDGISIYYRPAGNGLVVTGLDHLDGRYVVGLADGAPFGPILVTAGAATLPTYIAGEIDTLVIGLPVQYAGQPMRIDLDARAGNTQSLIKQISNVYVRVWNSSGGSVGNGTVSVPLWVPGGAYSIGNNATSPLTNGSYQCTNDLPVSAVDPVDDPENWTPFTPSTVQQAVPLRYSINPANPEAFPPLVTRPTDIRISPQLMPFPTHDPVVIVTGNDALPLTVLALIYAYDIISTP